MNLPVWGPLFKYYAIEQFYPLFFNLAAVSCSPTGARLAGVKLVSGLTGKLGRALVGAWACAWHGA